MVPILRLAAIVIGAAVFASVKYGVLIAQVRGGSMAPTYSEGDRLLAVRRRIYRSLRPGDVVVCRTPPGFGVPGLDAEALLVKRVAGVAGQRVPGSPSPAALPAGTVYVLGDDARHSADSREFGALPLGLVVGVVVCRLSGQSR